MSFAGSARRIWRITEQDNPWVRAVMVVLAVMLVAVAWCLVAVWYVVFSLLLVPYRLVRRGSRKRKLEEMRHREQLAAIDRR